MDLSELAEACLEVLVLDLDLGAPDLVRGAQRCLPQQLANERSDDALGAVDELACGGQVDGQPMHDDLEYDNAVELLDRLAVLDGRTEDQEEYLETLSGLVERYDDEHFAINDSDISPIESLRYLCEQNDMTASALGELLGNRSLGSKVLRGEQQPSKAHIR